MQMQSFRQINKLIASFVIVTMILVAMPVQPAFAATITVTTTADELTLTPNGDCSLREAVVNANDDAATYSDCSAGTGVDTIVLASGETYILAAGGSIFGDLDITDADGLTIQTSGTAPATIDANGVDRVVDAAPGSGALTLNNLVIKNGASATSSGGGIQFDGSGALTIEDSTISDNTSSSTGVCGAGIFMSASSPSLVIKNSSLAGNTCSGVSGDGGGLYYSNTTDGSLAVTNSTFYNNSAGPTSGGNGGALWINIISGSIDFSTFSNNTISNATSGGVHIQGGTITISNSILANTTGGANDCYRAAGAVSLVNSLVMTSPLTGSCGTPTFSDDPGLGAFQDNGGPTFTMAITSGSVAYDSASTCVGSNDEDQRGVSRPQGLACDLGAFEFFSIDTTTTVSCASPIAFGGDSSCTATVTRASGSNTPTGGVSWATADSGSFSGSPCTLSGSGGTATCSVTYTPSAIGDGTHGITATYGGDANFNGSSGNQNVTVVPGAGVYDDTDPNWSYTGSWSAYSGSASYYDHTTHYTTGVGNTASFTFGGTQFILTYTQAPNRGDIDVFVDGNQVATINATGALQFQKFYISPVFSNGAHEVEFKHAGGGGAYIDVDAIQILDTSIAGTGVYDDTDTNWSYSGSWTAYSGSAAYYNNTTHYTSGPGNTASFAFSGTKFILTYTQAPNRGNLGVFVDGLKITTIKATGALQFKKTYTSSAFSSGTHIVQIKHLGGGTYVDVDAIEVLNTAAPGVGVYDDTHANWSYSGSWVAYSGSVPYANNTVHYTAVVGDTATFTFNGTQFVLTYTQAPNRGNIAVFVDGSQVTTINATGALAFEQSYTSPVFSSGVHVVQFKHAGGGGAYADVDGIEVLNTAAPGTGVYDDTDANWSYSGSWAAYSGSAPYANNTVHYTSGLGDTATFTFDGTKFVLTYTQAPNRGSIGVFVDGIKIATINATGALQFKKTYTSPGFSSGVHVVQFKHADGGGAYIDVDALEIQ